MACLTPTSLRCVGLNGDSSASSLHLHRTGRNTLKRRVVRCVHAAMQVVINRPRPANVCSDSLTVASSRCAAVHGAFFQSVQLDSILSSVQYHEQRCMCICNLWHQHHPSVLSLSLLPAGTHHPRGPAVHSMFDGHVLQRRLPSCPWVTGIVLKWGCATLS